jgi:hypothetical protein
MVIFTFLPLYPRGNSPWHPLKRVGLDAVEKRKILHYWESNPGL